MNMSPTTTTTMKCQTKNGHVENVTCPLSINCTAAVWVGLIELTNSVSTTIFGWSPTSFIGLSFELNLSVYFIFSLFTAETSGFSWTVVPWMLSLWWNTFNQAQEAIRQQVFKSFRLELAWGLIGNCNCRQRYALPPALHDAAHNFTSSPAKRRKSECGMTDGTARTLEGRFPIRVLQGVAATAGTSVEDDMILVWGVGGVGRCSVLSTGIHPQKAPPASSATTRSSCS